MATTPSNQSRSRAELRGKSGRDTTENHEARQKKG